MEGYNRFAAERRMAEQSEAERQRVAEAMRAQSSADVPVETANRVTAAPTILTHITDAEAAWDNERDRVLHVWHERHQHDGVFLSQDDARWREFRASAATLEGLGAYETEHVLDGSGLTFGIELEVDDVDGDRIARDLYEAGLSSHPYERSYSSRVTTETGWSVKSMPACRVAVKLSHLRWWIPRHLGRHSGDHAHRATARRARFASHGTPHPHGQHHPGRSWLSVATAGSVHLLVRPGILPDGRGQ